MINGGRPRSRLRLAASTADSDRGAAARARRFMSTAVAAHAGFAFLTEASSNRKRGHAAWFANGAGRPSRCGGDSASRKDGLLDAAGWSARATSEPAGYRCGPDGYVAARFGTRTRCARRRVARAAHQLRFDHGLSTSSNSPADDAFRAISTRIAD